MNSPVFILHQPQMGENIGAVARAMSNFGLTDLRIVAPRDGWPNAAALAMAAGGASIIETASLYETLPEALHDITHLYATTARERALGKPVYTPREILPVMAAAQPSGRVALLFGAERAGLSNDDITLADAIITIPVSPSNPSINLAQTAVILAYEWHMYLAGEVKQPPCEPQRASKQEIDGFLQHAKPLLEAANYFREENKAALMWQHLSHIITRMQPTAQEIRTLRGLVRSLMRRLG